MLLMLQSAGAQVSGRVYRRVSTLLFYGEVGARGNFDKLSGAASAQKDLRGDSFVAVNGAARGALGVELTLLKHGLLVLAVETLRNLRVIAAENAAGSTTRIGPWLVGGTLGAGATW